MDGSFNIKKKMKMVQIVTSSEFNGLENFWGENFKIALALKGQRWYKL